MLEGSLKKLTPPTTPQMHTPPLLSPRSPRSSPSQVPQVCQIPWEHGVKLLSWEPDTVEVENSSPQIDLRKPEVLRTSLTISSKSSTQSTSTRLEEVRKRIQRAYKMPSGDDSDDEDDDDPCSEYSCHDDDDDDDVHAESSELTLQDLDTKIDCLMQLMVDNLKYTRAIHMSTKKSLTGPGHDCTPVIQRLNVPRQNVRFNSQESDRATAVGMAAMTPLLRMATPRVGMANAERHSVGALMGPCTQERHTETKNMLQLTRLIQKRTNQEGRIMGGWLWRFLEDRSSSKWALAYSYSNNVFIMFSVLLAVLEVIEASKSRYAHPFLMPAQCAIEFLFGIEILVRFMVCPNRKAFWLNFFNVLDAISAMPLILRVVSEVLQSREKRKFSDSVEFVSILCIVPVLRLVKLLRRFETVHLLLSAFHASIEALPVILFTLILIVLSFSAIIFYCEPRSNVPTFLDSLWFVMVTICGVAHGSPSPVNISGKVWTVVVMLAGILYMAIPIGIVGTAFSQIWEERSRLLLLMRMRNCVERSGYTPSDLKEMFKLLDEDGDGSLNYNEFAAMIDVMQIGVEERFVMEVFESFDADGEGSIDFRELLRGLFPRTHWLIENAEKVESNNTKTISGVCSIVDLGVIE